MDTIRPVVLVVLRHDGKLLVEEVYDKVNRRVYFRPLGGAITFGEYSQSTVHRTIVDVLGAEVTNVNGLGMLESIFADGNGDPAHELVFVYTAEFIDPKFYHQQNIPAKEGLFNFEAVWVEMNTFRDGDYTLIPSGLLELIDEADSVPLPML